jgi:putative ABC transport system permease protein
VGAVGVVAWSELRRRWRGTVAVTLLVGVVGAIVLATIAGARRSDSALARFNAYSRSATVELTVGPASPARLREFAQLPEVQAIAAVNTYAVAPQSNSLRNLAIGALIDSKLGSVVDRARVISGRRANLAAVDEVNIGEGLASVAHVGVGGHLLMQSYTPAQVAMFMRGVDAGPPAGPDVRLQVVGIVRRPLDLGDRGASGGVLILSPAFNRAYSQRIGSWSGEVLRVRTRSGDADIPRVTADAKRIFGRSPSFNVQGLAIESQGARNAISVLTVALLVFAGVAGLAGVVAISIVLNREVSLSSVDQPTLRALGSIRRQRVAIIGARALLVAIGGTLLAVGGAILASPFFPIGVARRADPDIGVHADWTVLILGVAGIVVLLAVITLVAARRATRQVVTERAYRRGPASALVEMSGSSLSPVATTGLRMAVEPGHGETAVPLRSAFFGAVLGVLGVTATLVFASSLGHLANTPRLYGWTWDFQTSDNSNSRCDSNGETLTRDPAVAALAGVCYQNIQINGRPLTAFAFAPVRGTIEPEIVAGRRPQTSDEVALGTASLHALGKHIGDVVHATGSRGPRTYRIVGRVVLPKLGDPQALADGAVFTNDGLNALRDPNDQNYSRYLVGSYAPGADRAAFARRVAGVRTRGEIIGPAVPPEVNRLEQIRWFPVALAVLLGGLALVAVGHALVTSVRRRRRELAILKTLGFSRGQVRGSVAWQATTLAVVGLVAGIPLGVLVGTAAWRVVAHGLGVSPIAVLPVAGALLVPAVIIPINLVAYRPARTAARTRPAVALQAE